MFLGCAVLLGAEFGEGIDSSVASHLLDFSLALLFSFNQHCLHVSISAMI